jgi:hypothetical protein
LAEFEYADVVVVGVAGAAELEAEVDGLGSVRRLAGLDRAA